MTTGPEDDALSELGRLVGLPGLRFDSNDSCQLVFNDGWHVTVMKELRRSQFYLHCPISTAADTATLDSALLSLMLRGNFMGRGAGGGSLAVGPDGRACLQSELAIRETDGRALLAAMERLLDCAETWAARLAAPGASPAAPMRPKMAPPLSRRMA
jgi:hypothetical protein